MKITISGLPGSGKTTIAKMIAKKLNFPFLSVGNIQGMIANKRKITIDELMIQGKKELNIHYVMDKKISQIGKQKDNFIIEGWIAYHFIPDSFKIFLYANEEKTARRVLNEKREDEPISKEIKGAKRQLKKRVENSKKGFQKAYGIDFPNKSKS